MQIDAPAEGGKYTLDIETELKWQVKSSASWITYNPGVGKGKGKVTVTIAKAAVTDVQTTATITISEYGSSNTDNVVDVSVSREVKYTSEAVFGAFSVAKDKLVYFSKGNLQYRASTGTWRFAEHQYDYVGDAELGTVYENGVKCDNSKISSTYRGWIDLFGWGTGNNPTLSSKSEADYSNFTDWGVNMISSNGKPFRTLTDEEWYYILYDRPNASDLYAPGTVNDVYGLIILPDKWSNPSGVTFKPSVKDWNYNDNSYSGSRWEKLEENGAIFLPAAGLRIGTEMEIGTVRGFGQYWSSTHWLSTPSYAYILMFGWNDAGHTGGTSRVHGVSVRLVQDL